jgi:hypothetical protein
MIKKSLKKEIKEKKYAHNLRLCALFFEKVYPECKVNGKYLELSGSDVEKDLKRMAEIFEELSKEEEF